MITFLSVIQRASLCYYTIIKYYYVIITPGSIITYYYLFQSLELADEGLKIQVSSPWASVPCRIVSDILGGPNCVRLGA